MRVGDRVHLAADPGTERRVARVLDAWRVRVSWLAHPTHARRWTAECVEGLERATPNMGDARLCAGMSAKDSIVLGAEAEGQ